MLAPAYGATKQLLALVNCSTCVNPSSTTAWNASSTPTKPGSPGSGSDWVDSPALLIAASCNIITPLMPYFPLIVTFTQKYHKKTGIGTLISVMLPYSIGFLLAWTVFLMAFWSLGLPLGLGASYTYGG